ncbi:hypothetical protein V9K92_14940 [Phyllobacterium sp. CCNWLW109]|uniref:hypothetical protein n=1 Tax=Phyllobacterium sp. CCNWLW109 TaxID=3127479 RepID=UPI0030777878
MTESVERFADATLVFVKRLCSHLSTSVENTRDADEILISVVSILMQSPRDLATLITADATEIHVGKPERPEDGDESFVTLYLRIMMTRDRRRCD